MGADGAAAGREPILPDGRQIHQFVQALFRYAEGPFVSLRAFGDGPDKASAIPIVRAYDLTTGNLAGLGEAAFAVAGDAARRPQAYVFCPPAATFLDPRKADEGHLCEGLTLSVELDTDPAVGLSRLEPVLGPATIVVESGGITTDGEPKLHAHWRLSEPARVDDHIALKEARMLATALSGGDPSNISIAHPIRWGGSIHRKSEPRRAEITHLRPEQEVHLTEALDALREAVENAGIEIRRSDSTGSAQRSWAPARPDGDRLREIAGGVSYHDNLRFFAASLVRAGTSRRRIQRLLEGFMDLVSASGRDERWAARAAAIPDLIDSAEAKFTPVPERAVLRLAAGRLPQIVDAAAVALGAHKEADVFAFGRSLVRLAPLDDGVARAARVTPLPLVKASARDLLTRLCQFETLKKGENKQLIWVETDCPSDIAESLLARGVWPNVRVLRGIAQCPVLRPDGSVVQREGYDSDTGLYLDFRGVSFPVVPTASSRTDALSALERLKLTISAYMWAGASREGDSDETPEFRQNRAAALALFLTASTRRTLDRAPGFLVNATAPGSGKGKIVDIAAIIATGAPAEIVCMKEAVEELPKVIDAALLTGAPILALDDVEPKHLTAAALRGLLTATSITARPMATSEFKAAPANILVTATGNGISLARDMVRRFIVVQIDPGGEHPEDRAFSFDPVAVALKQRPQLVVDCLTILAAYQTAGAPVQNGLTIGSFETWGRVVRDALLWLEEADPVATMQAMRGGDPAREELGTVMNAWEAVFGSAPTKVSAAMHSTNRELRDAIEMIGHGRNPRGFGEWLRRQKGRPLNGRRFITEGESGGAARWRLDGAKRRGGEGGEGGEDFSLANGGGGP